MKTINNYVRKWGQQYFVGFSKAYDAVKQDILIKKNLFNIGIKRKCYVGIGLKAFSFRYYMVKIDNICMYTKN